MWDKIWATRQRAVLGCVLTIVVLSSVLFYAVDWYWFYNTRAKDKVLEAEIYAKSVQEILLLTEGQLEAHTQSQVRHYITQMSPYLELTKTDGAAVLWRVSNDRKLDLSRSVVSKEFDLASGKSTYVLTFRYANTPPFLKALLRAWSWSVVDYMEDPERYYKYNLYNRSTPLYAAVAIVALLAIPLFSRIYKDKQSYFIMRNHLKDLEGKKDEALLALADVQRTTNERIKEKDERLVSISRELDAARSEVAETSEVSDGLIAMIEAEFAEVKCERQALLDEKDELQKAKEALESQYVNLHAELISTKSAMENLQRLTAMQFQIENTITGELANNTKLAKDSKTYNRLKSHLKKWVLHKGTAEVNISMHGTKKVISDALEKIDKAFLDEFFVHVRNERYSPSERRTIKIVPASSPNDYSGTINVYLDHDSGCALSFGYNVRQKAPVNNVGFILAVLLRAVCKDFEDYTIKAAQNHP